MTQEHQKCPEGRDAVALLAYLEGELAPAARGELEAHLKTCSWCRAELDRLRRADALLTAHPGAFHPSADDLHRFVSTGDDPGGAMALHLAQCESCREDALLLKELVASEPHSSGAPRMPESLKAQVRAMSVAGPHVPWYRVVRERLLAGFPRFPRVPMLAVGTAAAVLVVAVLVAPWWMETGKRQPMRAGSQMESAQIAAKPSAPAPTGREAMKVEPKLQLPERPEAEMERIPESRGTATGPAPRPELPMTVEKAPGAAVPALESEGPAARIRAGAPRRLKTRDAREPDHAASPAAPGMARGTTESKSGREFGPPRVRIVDEHGIDIPWLRYDPGTKIGEQRYDASERHQDELDRRSRVVSPRWKQEVGKEHAERQGLPVLVRVLSDATGFSIYASLMDSEADRPLRTLSEAGVPRDKLQETINALVGSLIELP